MDLAGVERHQQQGSRGLRDALRGLDEVYRRAAGLYVLDCPPSLILLTINVGAADAVRCRCSEFFALEG